MSMRQLQTELLQLLSLGKEHQKTIIIFLDELINKYSIKRIELWRNFSNKKRNTILHEFIEMDLYNVLHYFLKHYKFNINIKRESDGKTPFQLANQIPNLEMCNLLKRFGADQIPMEDDNELSNETNKQKMNIVWLDLEMTSLDNPEILECAVIITNKHLVELDRGNWVIHFEQSELEKLGEWHQNTFKNREEGGNGLFDDSLRSKLTREQVENELFDLIEQYCPEKMCPLAGSSIHTDKEVLKRCMPKVHDYLHYRIIDVSSFQAITKRWTPWIECEIKKSLAKDGPKEVKHRAMDDIEWSISYMKMFRPHLGNQREPNNRNHERRPANNHKRSASAHLVRRQIELPRNNRGNDKPQLYADEKQLVERLEIERMFDVKTLHLTQRDQQIYNRNPHLREVFINRQHLQMNERDFTVGDRVPISPNNQLYNNRVDSNKFNTTEHWGQRKLLLTEIEFLTNYAGNNAYTVIYAGAAPGLHIQSLSSLFPRLKFILIDAKNFSVKETENISIIRQNFTTDLAEYYSKLNHELLFICNVYTYNTNDNLQKNVLHDMENQMIWHQLMRPRVSLLNLRLPRTSNKFPYLQGELCIEPWASRRAIECRLVVDKYPKTIEYDTIIFEETMIYFHHVRRIMYYKHNMNDVDTEGLDHCYDCTAEIFILQQYFKKVIKIDNELDLKKETAKLSSDISRHINDKDRPKITGTIRTLDVIPKK